MINKINNLLKRIYKISGYTAAIFLIFVALFILTGIISRIFNFYVRGLAEYSGYSMAASSFFALAYTFYDKAHIRITLFLEKLKYGVCP
jgi:TRAP-type C4-dicarboxylate transport system permease small subunit